MESTERHLSNFTAAKPRQATGFLQQAKRTKGPRTHGRQGPRTNGRTNPSIRLYKKGVNKQFYNGSRTTEVRVQPSNAPSIQTTARQKASRLPDSGDASVGSDPRGSREGLGQRYVVKDTEGKELDMSSLLHTLEKMEDSESRIKRLTDLKTDCTFKYGVLVVLVSGFVSSSRQWESEVVQPALRLCPGEHNMRLSLDLRRLFFVSKKTVVDILYHMGVWSSTRFRRICLVLPPAKIVRHNLRSALELYLAQPPVHHEFILPEFKCVERARDVKAFLERT